MQNARPYESFRETASYESYPFDVEGISNRPYRVKPGEQLLVNHETGEIGRYSALPSDKVLPHDSLSYVKLFRHFLGNLRNMSIPAYNFLMMVCARIQPGAKEVCITEDDFLDYCGYKRGSRRLYYQGALELINMGVLKKKAGGPKCFWVNANVLFNGDRTKTFNI